MKYLTGLLFAGSLMAVDIRLDWTPAPNLPTGAAHRIEHKEEACSGTTKQFTVLAASVPTPTATYLHTSVNTGPHCYRVIATAPGFVDSAPSPTAFADTNPLTSPTNPRTTIINVQVTVTPGQ